MYPKTTAARFTMQPAELALRKITLLGVQVTLIVDLNVEGTKYGCIE
jgi:hypothetical protein